MLKLLEYHFIWTSYGPHMDLIWTSYGPLEQDDWIEIQSHLTWGPFVKVCLLDNLPDFVPTSIAYNMSISTLHNWRKGNSFTYWAFHSFFQVTFETDNVGLLSILLITCLYCNKKKNQNWIHIKLVKIAKSLKLLFQLFLQISKSQYFFPIWIIIVLIH